MLDFEWAISERIIGAECDSIEKNKPALKGPLIIKKWK